MTWFSLPWGLCGHNACRCCAIYARAARRCLLHSAPAVRAAHAAGRQVCRVPLLMDAASLPRAAWARSAHTTPPARGAKMATTPGLRAPPHAASRGNSCRTRSGAQLPRPEQQPSSSPPSPPLLPSADAPPAGVDTLLGRATHLFTPAGRPRGGMLGSLLRGSVAGVARVVGAPSRWLASRRAAASWAEANDILETEVLPAVRAAFPNVQPFRTRYADAARPDAAVPFAAADGAITGEVAVYKGAPIDWLVVARVWSRSRGFGSARLDAFLDDATDVPHLQVHITILPSGAFLIYFDCPPRCDLVLHDAYLQRVYLQPPPGQPRSLSDVVAACLRDEDMTPFISRDGTVRAFMASPAVMLFTLPPGRRGAQRVRSLAKELTAAWAALATSPVPDAERKALLDSKDGRAALRRRDAAIRDFVRRDPDTKNVVPVLGDAQLAEMLMQLLSGTPQP